MDSGLPEIQFAPLNRAQDMMIYKHGSELNVIKLCSVPDLKEANHDSPHSAHLSHRIPKETRVLSWCSFNWNHIAHRHCFALWSGAFSLYVNFSITKGSELSTETARNPLLYLSTDRIRGCTGLAVTSLSEQYITANSSRYFSALIV